MQGTKYNTEPPHPILTEALCNTVLDDLLQSSYKEVHNTFVCAFDTGFDYDFGSANLIMKLSLRVLKPDGKLLARVRSVLSDPDIRLGKAI